MIIVMDRVLVDVDVVVVVCHLFCLVWSLLLLSSSPFFYFSIKSEL
jgi:hypothetical protein